MRKYFLVLSILFFFTSLNLVLAIDNPRAVDYLKLKLTESGKVEIKPTDSRFGVDSVELSIRIPQEDGRQSIESIEVFPEDYTFASDGYGNKIIKISWKRPSSVFLDYRIKILLKVKRASEIKQQSNQTFLTYTNLTTADENMIKVAKEVGGAPTFEKIANLAKWVNENIVYDSSLVKEIKSAQWVFSNRKGSCDEYSDLFIALARSLNVPSRYVSGIAYSKDWFEPHGWVEVYLNNRWVEVDPTWLEVGYTDATHVKLAIAPDGNVTESILIKGYNVEVNWTEPTDYSVDVIEEGKSSLLIFEQSLINNEVGESGYSIVSNNITSQICGLFKLSLNSCKSNGKDFMKIYDTKAYEFICNQKQVNWILRSPSNLSESRVYSCPLILQSDFEEKEVRININPKKVCSSFEVYTSKLSLLPEQKFNLSIVFNSDSAKKLKLYRVQDGLEAEELDLKPGKNYFDYRFQAPEKTGEYKIWFVTEEGCGGYVNLSVKKEKLVRIENLELPNATKGSFGLVKVWVKSFSSKELSGSIKLKLGEKVISRYLTLTPGETRLEAFNTSFEKEGKQFLQVEAEADGDFDIRVYEMNVLKKQVEEGIFMKIWSFVLKLFSFSFGLRKF